MITNCIEYRGWDITLHYDIDKSDIGRVQAELLDFGCSGKLLERALTALDNFDIDRGMTIANTDTFEILICVSRSSSKSEFLNTMVHELYHCGDFISHHDDPEESAYIIGDLAKLLYKDVHTFLCERCH